MRPCNQCGKAVENDLDYCDHCSSSSSSSSKDVLGTNRTATPVSVPADDDTIAAHDNRFFAIGYVATLATTILICCQVFAYLQWPWPFAIFA